MDPQIKKGLLDECILASLRNSDSYGYRILQNINKYFQMSESTLYPIMKRLVGGGYLTTYSQEHNGRLRKYYSITPSGRQKLADFKIQWEELKKIYNYIMGEDHE